ncbi:CBS domain-containing protein [Inquilinus sp. YAF38]|jgi:CBS domain-containing protein|uniref:CBS domain-containing protein n=1 Tax=Inquilinus sp. YAF38 TaxID=3233084 RepID=UPI003F92719C
MRAEDILRQKDSRVVMIRVGETVATAVALMTKEIIGALVVKEVCRTEGNVVVGVFSERDVARALATHGAAALAMPVSAFMGRTVISCEPRDSIETVLRLMDENHIRHVPVMEDHTLVGVISARDLIRHFLQQSSPALQDPAAAVVHA